MQYNIRITSACPFHCLCCTAFNYIRPDNADMLSTSVVVYCFSAKVCKALERLR